MSGKKKIAYQSLPPHDLHHWLQQGRELFIIDTLPEEQYQKRHLPEAVNICVFEMTFIENVRKAIPESEADIIVYGESWESFDAAAAAEKLVRAGYRNVNTLEGGTRAWAEAGLVLEGTDPDVVFDSAQSFRIESRSYKADIQRSRIEWKGRNASGSHTGTLQLASGSISAENGTFSGAFQIDMASIANTDIDDADLRSLLIRHLHSDDFFFTKAFPTAEFLLESGRPLEVTSPGSANFEINGALKLRGRSVNIRFPATVSRKENGGIAAEAHFDIDRTIWGIIYGSGKFFKYLGQHLVYDAISLDLRIIATQTEASRRQCG